MTSPTTSSCHCRRIPCRRAAIVHEREFAEAMQERAGDSPRHLMIFPDEDPKEKLRRREQLAWEQALRDRQDQLLARIEQCQVEIEKRRQQIEDNALRLRDGRRIYVDGDHYRDAEGRVLTGADEAEAARQHEYQPHASTWEQKQQIDRKAEEARILKEKILKDREEGVSPEEAEKRLKGQEREFAQQAQEQAAKAPVDYGSADYMADYGAQSAVTAFTQAAAPDTRETIRKPAEAADTGTQTAEMKKTPRPAGQGALKV